MQFNGRKIKANQVSFGRYIEDCELISAEWADSGEPLTNEEMEAVWEDDDFRNEFEEHIWGSYPEKHILAMDQ